MKEKDIQNAILEYLQARGHFVWRNNTGFSKREYTTRSGETRTSVLRAGIIGSSDIIGAHRETGQFIAIEVKRPGNKPTEYQRDFLDRIGECNGIAIVATSLDDVMGIL